MNATSKKKLCWNCEGSVSLQQENCPYCGVYLSPIMGNEAGILSPPYRMSSEEDQDHVPPAPFRKQEETEDLSDSEQPKGPMNSGDQDQVKSVILSLAFLLSGSVFFLFGIILLLFSEGGLFTLQWEGSYWFIYLLIGIPFLYIGWRSLQGIED